MLDYYFIGKEKVITTDKNNYNWLVIDSSDTKEIEQVIEKYRLPKDIFVEFVQPGAENRESINAYFVYLFG